MHGCDAVTAEEVDKILLAHGLHLAGFDGLGGDLVGNIGQHRAQAHHVAGAGDFEDHGLAVARSGGDFYLSEADHKDVTRRVALGKELGAAGMAHHDADAVIVGEGFGGEIAEHPQMAMFTIHAIFRGVMGMKCCHELAGVQTEYSALGRDARQGFSLNLCHSPEKVPARRLRWLQIVTPQPIRPRGFRAENSRRGKGSRCNRRGKPRGPVPPTNASATGNSFETPL